MARRGSPRPPASTPLPGSAGSRRRRSGSRSACTGTARLRTRRTATNPSLPSLRGSSGTTPKSRSAIGRRASLSDPARTTRAPRTRATAVRGVGRASPPRDRLRRGCGGTRLPSSATAGGRPARPPEDDKRGNDELAPRIFSLVGFTRTSFSKTRIQQGRSRRRCRGRGRRLRPTNDSDAENVTNVKPRARSAENEERAEGGPYAI